MRGWNHSRPVTAVTTTLPNSSALSYGEKTNSCSVLCVQGGTEVRQYLESRMNLTGDESWTAIYTNEPDTPVTNTVTVSPVVDPRFYRIRAER